MNSKSRTKHVYRGTGSAPFIPPHIVEISNELGIASSLLAERGLISTYEEVESLEIAETEVGGREHLLTAAAAQAWREMKAAALRDNISLFIVSGFRSIERQAEIIRRKLCAGAPIEDVLAVCAPPGFSEHHTGRAIDISTPDSKPLEVEFDQTIAYAWLTKNAEKFGFFLSYPAENPEGYQYEPWHWCFHVVASNSQASGKLGSGQFLPSLQC